MSYLSKCNLFIKKWFEFITPLSPPGRGRCSQRKHPHVLTELSQWCECCGQRSPWTPPSAGSAASLPQSAHEGALEREKSVNSSRLQFYKQYGGKIIWKHLMLLLPGHLKQNKTVLTKTSIKAYLLPPVSVLEPPSPLLSLALQEPALPLPLLLLSTECYQSRSGQCFIS